MRIFFRLFPFSIRKRIPPYLLKYLWFKGFFDVIYQKEKLFTMYSAGYQMENEIFYRGVEEGPESLSTRIWIDFIKTHKPKHVYDIGANTGYFGLLAKSILDETTISFFEPQPRALELLEGNLSRNGFSANVFPYALSNYNGEGFFLMAENSNFAYSITLNSDANFAITGIASPGGDLVKIETKVKRLSQVIHENNMQLPNLVKIDVETHEFEVLEGFGFGVETVDAYLIEVLTDECANKLNFLFNNKGFRYFNLNEATRVVTETSRIERSKTYNYFLVKSGLVPALETLVP